MITGSPIIDNLTIQDFKNEFTRGFNYVDNWDSTKTYNIGNGVFYTNNKFYQCLNNTVTSVPTTISDWMQLNDNSLVSDQDITSAFNKAKPAIDIGNFTDDNIRIGFLYLAAHYLSIEINFSGGLLQSQGLINSRAAGGVSEGLTIPDWMLKSIIYSNFTRTFYGNEYLQMIYAMIQSNKYNVLYGRTLP